MESAYLAVGCVKCGGVIQVPTDFTLEEKDRIAALREGRESFSVTIQAIRGLCDLDLREVKRLYTHLTKTLGKCHRCGRELPEGSLSTCQHRRCQSLNIEWRKR